MTVKECDRCGKDNRRGLYIASHELPVADMKAPFLKWSPTALDLCMECFEQITYAITRELEAVKRKAA